MFILHINVNPIALRIAKLDRVLAILSVIGLKENKIIHTGWSGLGWFDLKNPSERLYQQCAKNNKAM